jgi:hypothetical protein
LVEVGSSREVTASEETMTSPCPSFSPASRSSCSATGMKTGVSPKF